MDSESKAEDVNESDISRFTLDGVVAEMVIEVDEEEVISPTKTLTLNGLEKYEALKASALRKSSVVLDSKMNTGIKGRFVKEIESDSGKSEESGKDLEECNTDLKPNVTQGKSKEDSHPVKDAATIVSTTKCVKDKHANDSEDELCEDLEDQESENFKMQPEVSEGKQSETSENKKCDIFEVKVSEEKQSEEIENQDSIAPEKQEVETSEGKQIELSETKKLKSLGKRKSKVSGKKEFNVSETHSKEESVGEEENFKRSSNRTKAKDVKEERETRSSANQSSKDGRISQFKTVSALPENKKNSLRGRLQTNAAKSVLTKAKLTVQNKKTEKAVTIPELKRGRKRKLQDPEPKKEEIVKKQKQTENAPELKPRLKSSKSIPSLSEAAISRRHSLRKPSSIVSTAAKPKAFNLYPKSDCRLDSFIEVKEQLNVADLKYLRALYRLMYDRWPPKDLEELKKEILQFQGFTFNRKSDELEKRQHVLKKLPDASVLQICKILDLKEGTKDNMISDIIKFLLKPIKVVYSVMDPFQPSMQPIVKLEKISLECNTDDKYVLLVKSLDDKSNKAIKISKRKRFPSSRLSEYVSGIESLTSETRTSDSTKMLASTKTEAAKTEKRNGRSKRKVNTSESADDKDLDEASAKKTKTEELLGKGTTKLDKNVLNNFEEEPKQAVLSTVLNAMTTRNKGNKMQPTIRRNELFNLAARIQNSKSPVKTTEEDESVTLSATSVGIKEELVDEPDVPMEEAPETEKVSDKSELCTLTEKQTAANVGREDSSSELTLSSDETKEQETKQDSSRRKKVVHKRSGKALRCFHDIKENILNANFSALQRLHILLFGASDKVENLKTNILSFGGFPFLVGSEEWKQKEFLLSLLAQNTLREYLNLLCIEHGDDDNHTLINKLMVFLASPKEKGSGQEIITQVISSEPISHAPAQETTQSKRSVLKKKTDLPSKETRPVVVPMRRGPRYRKVLMDEEQVRRLESDFAREQRILEREKRQVEKLKLMNELNVERSDAKSKIKHCQAVNCKNNSKDNRDLSFFNFPSEPVRLEKWLSNIELKPTSKKYNAFLCSKHFDVRAFTNTCKNARLLRFAVPTIPAPGSARPVKYPCLDGYSTPGTSRLKQVPSPSKKDEVANSSLTMSIDVDTIPNYEPGKTKSPVRSSDSKQAPLQKLIGDMTKKRASMMAQQTDSELLDALLQTVYKRRALKSAGAVISIPNKGVHTRLGELDNVKFLVVTANYNDLDVLHHLIYMTEATKTRVRKNILDFAGFNFAEDSTPYKDRMEFLESLGYDISKRIGFLLGLCPYKMDIPQQDLNELIMYFLMSPCKSKQVPIRHLPQNFFTKDMPKELCLLLQKHSESVSPDNLSPKQTNSPEKNVPIVAVLSEDDSPPKIIHHQKAKKSFKSSSPSTVKRNPTSPSVPIAQRKQLTASPRGRPASKRPFQLPNILTKPPPTTVVQPPPLQKSILKPPTVVSNFAKTAPQEFLIQQQTPDGQQKTYKLIKLPASHPLNSAIKTPAVQSQLLPQLQSNTPIAGPPLPPGIIVFKNNPAAENLQSVVNPVPQIELNSALSNVTVRNPELTITPVLTDTSTSKGPAVPEKSDEIIPLQFDYNEKVEVLHPLEDSNPTDEELYSSIQEIIHNSNFEDITLRNVIDRVSAQYATFNLTKRHSFMKECVKKIIIGT